MDSGLYVFVSCDALTMKVREGGRVVKTSVLLATGVNADGYRELLGMHVATAESTASWMNCSPFSGLGYEVPRVLFLGICLDFHYFSTGVVFPKFGFDFSRGAVVQALVEP
ncbi:Transposase, Mutator family [Corynebacterium epidermidicanis]|uniref:Mutator family transposase n=1 Tax=Corynebacterium epidermidicanis TaxID=1050174 RepID=A0A0G3GL45_9CORY|nr:Transposase, Mutator family [Corynebacterium epidermidicanis]